MSNVFTLGGKEFDFSSLASPEPNQEVIELARNLLKRAEQGYLQEMVVVASFADGMVAGEIRGKNEEYNTDQAMFGEIGNMALSFRDLYLNPLTTVELEQ